MQFGSSTDWSLFGPAFSVDFSLLKHWGDVFSYEKSLLKAVPYQNKEGKAGEKYSSLHSFAKLCPSKNVRKSGMERQSKAGYF